MDGSSATCREEISIVGIGCGSTKAMSDKDMVNQKGKVAYLANVCFVRRQWGMVDLLEWFSLERDGHSRLVFLDVS